MNIIKDINKLIIDVVKAINLIFFIDTPLFLETTNIKTPKMGITSNEDNNIRKKKKIYLCRWVVKIITPNLY